MNLGRVYDIILTVLRKEGKGNIIKPDRFTYLLQQCHLEYYNQQYEKWAGSQAMIDSLRPFLIFDEVVTFAGTQVALSALTGGTYKHALTARLSTGDYLCDIVTPAEWNEWAADALMKGIATSPLIMIDGTNINITPTLSGDIKFSYLVSLGDVKYDSGTTTGTTADKLVDSAQNFLTTIEAGMTVYNTTDGTTATVDAIDSNTTLSLSSDIMTSSENYFIIQDDAATDYFLPFFDYYIDAYRDVQYIANGTTYTLGASEVYRDGSTSGTKVVGVSHELKWGDQDIVNIISLILEKIGVSLSSPDIAQYAMAKEQSQNVM